MLISAPSSTGASNGRPSSSNKRSHPLDSLCCLWPSYPRGLEDGATSRNVKASCGDASGVSPLFSLFHRASSLESTPQLLSADGERVTTGADVEEERDETEELGSLVDRRSKILGTEPGVRCFPSMTVEAMDAQEGYGYEDEFGAQEV